MASVCFDLFLTLCLDARMTLDALQTLNTISAEKNSTIVFPLPIDMLTYFMKAQEAASS
jgi:erythrocyte band 7 integral membrane protein